MDRGRRGKVPPHEHDGSDISGILSGVIIDAEQLNVDSLSAITGSMGSLSIDGTLTLGSGGSIVGTNLTIDSDGSITATDVNLTGTIDATSGSIGNLTIDGTLTLGTGGSISGSKLTIASDGAITATGADITGTITATSGTIGGFTLGAQSLTATGLVIDHSTSTPYVRVGSASGLYAYIYAATTGAGVEFHDTSGLSSVVGLNPTNYDDLKLQVLNGKIILQPGGTEPVDITTSLTVDTIDDSGAGAVTINAPVWSYDYRIYGHATSGWARGLNFYEDDKSTLIGTLGAYGPAGAGLYYMWFGGTTYSTTNNLRWSSSIGVYTAGNFQVQGIVSADLAIGSASVDAQLAVNNTTGTTLTIDRETSTAGAYLFEAYSNVGGTGTQVAFLEADGDWKNVNGTYTTISDIRTKKDVKVARSYLLDLIEMSEREAWITYESLLQPGHRLLGVNAQKAEKVWPGMVKTSPEWTVLPDGKRIHAKSFKTSVLPVMNSTAIVELAKRVEQLEARLKELEGRAA